MPSTETPNTEWLTAAEMRAWLAYVDLSALLGDYLDRQLQRDSGMSHTTYHLLARLSGAPDRSLGLTALAENLRITRSRLSHALTKLEKSGWIVRAGDPSDKRGQLATLTDRGVEAVTAAAPGHIAAVRRAVFDNLTQEQTGQLAQIGESIVVALVRQDPHAPPYPDELPWRRR